MATIEVEFPSPGNTFAMPTSFAAAQDRVFDAYGVEAASRMVRTASGAAHVLVCGSGPSVVMIHGLGAPAALWAPLLGALADHTVYAIDLPGHGLSPASREQVRPSTLRRTMSSFLAQVLDDLSLTEPVSFVGNSLGSLCATWLALDEPKRVRGLAHIGCPALIVGASAPLGMRIASMGGVGPVLLKLRRATRSQVETLARSLGDSLDRHPALRDLLVAQDVIPGYKDQLRNLSRSLIRVRGARPEVRLTAQQLSKVSQPVRLIWGDRDPFGPLAIARRAAAALPVARLDFVSGGHVPWLSSPDQVGRLLLDFLASPGVPYSGDGVQSVSGA